jgi:hypothetical protein
LRALITPIIRRFLKDAYICLRDAMSHARRHTLREIYIVDFAYAYIDYLFDCFAALLVDLMLTFA